MFTCSAFGPAIDAVKRDQRIPVLKPNEALYDALMKQSGRIALLSTFEPTLPSMMAEIADRMAAQDVKLDIDTHLVPGALDALFDNRPDEHNRLVAEAAAQFAGHDVVAFAQISMTPALALAQARVGTPILTTLGTSIRKLKALLA